MHLNLQWWPRILNKVRLSPTTPPKIGSGRGDGALCPAGFGHLSWFDHISSVSTLIQPPPPPPTIWAPQHLFIWLYSINNIPPTHTHTYAHTSTIHQTPQFGCNYDERTQGRLKETLAVPVCFSFNCMHSDFSYKVLLIPPDDPSLYLLTLNDGTPPKWFVSSLKQRTGIQ